MTLISRNVHVSKLDDIVNEYKNTYHNTNKLKPADVKSSIYIDLNQEYNKEDPKFSVDDHAKTSKQKHFCKRLRSKLAWKSFCW